MYYVSIQGTETNRATNQYRRLRINGDSSWINTSMYTYVTNVPVTNNKLLKSPWVFQLEGTVSKSTGTYRLIPEITFQYIYPVLPQ